MSRDFEELLRDSMERFTQDIEPPHGLAERAARRRRRRLGGLAATAAVTMLTAGTLAASLVTSSPSPATRSASAVVLTARIQHALANQGVSQVEEATTTAAGRAKDTMVVWSYGSSLKTSVSADGHPVYSFGVTTGASPRTVYVEYPSRSFWRSTSKEAAAIHGSGPLMSHCGVFWPFQAVTASGWTSFIRSELSCGTFRITGHQRVDGVNAIKVTGTQRSDLPLVPKARLVSTLLVDPGSYLPLRATFSLSGERNRGWQADFRWLAPTPANLANLSVSIPAGFRRVAPWKG